MRLTKFSSQPGQSVAARPEHGASSPFPVAGAGILFHQSPVETARPQGHHLMAAASVHPLGSHRARGVSASTRSTAGTAACGSRAGGREVRAGTAAAGSKQPLGARGLSAGHSCCNSFTRSSGFFLFVCFLIKQRDSAVLLKGEMNRRAEGWKNGFYSSAFCIDRAWMKRHPTPSCR